MGALEATTIDSNLLTEIVNAAQSLLGLFTSYPLNIFVGCGIGIAIFKVVRSAKKTAK